MPETPKIRVAMAATASAIADARHEVTAAVGRFPVVELQELDRRDVVLELALPGPPPAPKARQLARQLASASQRAEVLGAWDEVEVEVLTPSETTRRPQRVCDAHHAVADPVAHRAVVDGVPTAGWVDTEHSWHLAVPVVAADGRVMVALSWRRGYCYRFTGLDARLHVRHLTGGGFGLSVADACRTEALAS